MGGEIDTRRLRSARLLGLLGLACARIVLSQPDSEEVFSEKMTVTERTVYVDDSVLPALGSSMRRARSNFLVRIDGASAELVESAAEEPPMVTHLVWLDRDLASQASMSAAANQLASALLSFPERENFSIVEAGGSSPPFQESLSRTNLVLRLRVLASQATPSREPIPTLERRIAALNRMAAELPRYQAGDLGALWLVVEPWQLDPIVFEEILRADAEEVFAPSLLGALQRTSRILASYGWVIFPISAARGAPSEELRVSAREDQAEKFLERGPSPRQDRPSSALLFRLLGGGGRRVGSRESRNLSRSLDLATDFRLSPLAMMARTTSGALAGDAWRIGELAERLRNRRPLVVRDATSAGADLRRVEVVWLGGDGRAVPALPWAASQTSPELGVARLLSAVGSASSRAGASLRLRPADSSAGSAPAICFACPRARGALRLLWWSAAGQRIEIGEPTAGTQSPESADADCVPLPEGLAGEDVVQLEVMETSEWGAGRLSELSVR